MSRRLRCKNPVPGIRGKRYLAGRLHQSRVYALTMAYCERYGVPSYMFDGHWERFVLNAWGV